MIVILPRMSYFQVQLIVNLNTLSILYQGWYRPYELPGVNKKELVNEAFIQLNTYFLITYSDFVGDAEARYTMGWTNIVCLAIMLAFNLFVTLVWQTQSLFRWCKLRKLQIKQ